MLGGRVGRVGSGKGCRASIRPQHGFEGGGTSIDSSISNGIDSVCTAVDFMDE